MWIFGPLFKKKKLPRFRLTGNLSIFHSCGSYSEALWALWLAKSFLKVAYWQCHSKGWGARGATAAGTEAKGCQPALLNWGRVWDRAMSGSFVVGFADGGRVAPSTVCTLGQAWGDCVPPVLCAR